MALRSDALTSRILTVLAMFVVSSCVINRAHSSSKDHEMAAESPESAAQPERRSGVRAETNRPEVLSTQAGKPVQPAANGKSSAPNSASVNKNPRPANTSARTTPPEAGLQPASATIAAPEKGVRANSESAKSSNEKATRYVTAEALNVRSAPRSDAQIVGRLVRGSMVTVEFRSNWAKVGEGQYVLGRYLGKSAPSQSTRRVALHEE